MTNCGGYLWRLEEREQGYIILHEQHHVRRLDHVVKALAYLALCIHWFNPLVWGAFACLGKDMEMNCDGAAHFRRYAAGFWRGEQQRAVQRTGSRQRLCVFHASGGIDDGGKQTIGAGGHRADAGTVGLDGDIKLTHRDNATCKNFLTKRKLYDV